MILAINTSTPQFSIAFMEVDGTLRAEYLLSPGSNSFRTFMPALDQLFRAAQITIREITCLVIARGPGSFTGLRVGFSVAKGICHGLHVPVIGVSSLEALASQMSLTGYPVCALIRSRKQEVFAAVFECSSPQKLLRHTNDTCLTFEDFPGFFMKKTLFIGNDFNTQGPLIKDKMGEKALLAAAHLWNLRASAVGHIGLRRIEDQDYDHLRDLVPVYLKPPDIRPEPPFAQGTGGTP